MNDREYDRKYGELRRKQEEAEDQVIAGRQLKERLIHEEEQLVPETNQAIGLLEEMEEKWYRNAPEQKRSFRWDDVITSMQRMQAERNSILDDEFGELQEYIKEQSLQEESYEQQLQKLKREYREDKEEKHGESDRSR